MPCIKACVQGQKNLFNTPHLRCADKKGSSGADPAAQTADCTRPPLQRSSSSSSLPQRAATPPLSAPTPATASPETPHCPNLSPLTSNPRPLLFLLLLSSSSRDDAAGRPFLANLAIGSTRRASLEGRSNPLFVFHVRVPKGNGAMELRLVDAPCSI
jgi:hypothetical protein